MPNVHPNLSLTFDLDASWNCPEARQELKRSYAFIVGSMAMESHGEVGEDAVADDVDGGAEQETCRSCDPLCDAATFPENNLVMNVSLHAPYWDAQDERAQVNWPAFESWLCGKLDKISSALVGVNAARAKKGQEPFTFSWLALNMKGVPRICVHLNTDSSVDPGTVAMVSQIRDLMGFGAWGEGVTGVRIPSREFFFAQFEEALANVENVADAEAAGEEPGPETADPEATGQGSEEPAATAGEPAILAGAEGAGESQNPEGLEPSDQSDPSDQDAEARDAADKPAEAEKSAPAPAPKHPQMPSFSIDYGLWDVEYADGKTACYDAVSGGFCCD